MTAAAVEPTEKAEIPFNKQPRDWRKAGVIVAFSAIPVALLVIFTYWPFGSMIGYSFYKMKYIGRANSSASRTTSTSSPVPTRFPP